jgi:hypothetical protein
MRRNSTESARINVCCEKSALPQLIPKRITGEACSIIGIMWVSARRAMNRFGTCADIAFEHRSSSESTFGERPIDPAADLPRRIRLPSPHLETAKCFALGCAGTAAHGLRPGVPHHSEGPVDDYLIYGEDVCSLRRLPRLHSIFLLTGIVVIAAVGCPTNEVRRPNN